MDRLSGERLEASPVPEECASHIAIGNFGCRQGELVLVRKWRSLAEPQQPACDVDDPPGRNRRGLAWPLGLLVYHFLRR